MLVTGYRVTGAQNSMRGGAPRRAGERMETGALPGAKASWRSRG